MSDLINELISALLQIAVFSLIPFLFFLFRKNKNETFRSYIGLYKPRELPAQYIALAILLFIVSGCGLIFMVESIKEAVLSPNSVTGKLRTAGLSGTSVLALLIVAILKTSFAEEILFRGFLAKRVITMIGFGKGNIIQATIFGLLHLLLFFVLTKTTLLPLILIFILTSCAGWVCGYLNEKRAKGSILPGWIAHATGNVAAYFIIAFLI